MSNRKKVYLSGQHDAILKKICRSCHYYKYDEDVRDICSIIGWYIHVKNGLMTFKELVKYVKGCPCNQKCLVKPACREENCPAYLKYVNELNENRMNKVRQNLWKKNIHAKNVS